MQSLTHHEPTGNLPAGTTRGQETSIANYCQ